MEAGREVLQGKLFLQGVSLFVARVCLGVLGNLRSSAMLSMFLSVSLVFERFPHVPAENAGKTQIATGCDLCFSGETGLFCHGLFHNGNYVFECVFGL